MNMPELLDKTINTLRNAHSESLNYCKKSQ